MFPRQDLTKSIYALYTGTRDTLEYNIEMTNFYAGVFAICPRLEANRLRKERYDIVIPRFNLQNTFTRQSSDKNLPEDIVVLTEHGDISNLIITNELAKRIKKLEKYFIGLYMSDQPQKKPEK